MLEFGNTGYSFAPIRLITRMSGVNKRLAVIVSYHILTLISTKGVLRAHLFISTHALHPCVTQRGRSLGRSKQKFPCNFDEIDFFYSC